MRFRNLKIELSRSYKDWEAVRECYVRSFHRYPLYKYMVPDDTKRDDFLRAYLDANYEVTVGSGQGILLVIRFWSSDDSNNDPETNSKETKVIGGVLFLPPSADGCGWAIGNDEPYWQAYEKHGLAKISEEGYQRVIRYEAWENEKVNKKVSKLGIPLWNGLFCAISPEYSSQGLGTLVYKKAIDIMTKYWVQKQMSTKIRQTYQRSQSVKETKQQRMEQVDKIVSLCKRRLSLKELKEHFTVFKDEFVSKDTMSHFTSMKCNKARFSAPLVVAISHSDRAAHFHQSNGFHPVSKVPFFDDSDNITHFNTHILALDPFSTGRLHELTSGLQKDVSLTTDLEITQTSHLYDTLKSAPTDKIIVK
ncbi:unnamed protein product [Clavelina lepadiformis]|uniref:N-acetyltransferase domain-containing protein n=1 Tax=Clavelina lepadiformis TaxID=159417 RepID=A0ABP0F945_CLALP